LVHLLWQAQHVAAALKVPMTSSVVQVVLQLAAGVPGMVCLVLFFQSLRQESQSLRQDFQSLRQDMSKLHVDIAAVGLKLDKLGSKLDKDFAALGSKLDKDFAALGSKLDKDFAALGSKMDQLIDAANKKRASERVELQLLRQQRPWWARPSV
jgi:hypothetical protein